MATGVFIDVTHVGKGAIIRSLQKHFVQRLEKDFIKMGFVETMDQILVVENPSAVGQWRCVNGMHRVTALQNLVQTGMNDKFQRVPMTIFHPDIT